MYQVYKKNHLKKGKVLFYKRKKMKIFLLYKENINQILILNLIMIVVLLYLKRMKLKKFLLLQRKRKSKNIIVKKNYLNINC